jgi:DNA-binding NarL/FixJ family response regulator
VLSGSDGIEVIEKLKESVVSPKIVVLTAFSSEEIISRVMSLGANYFMAKPYNFSLLKERMEDLSAEEPTLIEVVVDSVSDDDIEYMKDLVVELIAESLTGERLNKDWQPRTAISNMLNTTIKAQTTLLNYSIVPSVLNIVFTKEGQEVYNLIKK